MDKSFSSKMDNFFILVESTLTGMVMVDRNGIILYANPAAEQLFCMSRESLVGTTFGFPLLTEKTEEILIPRKKSFATVEMQVAEMPWQDKNAYLVSLHDISALKQTEQSLIEYKEMQQLALNAAKAGTWEWDFRTNVFIWSKELWELYLLEDRNLAPTYETWIDSILPEDRPTCEFSVREAVKKGSELNLEWRVNNLNNPVRWLMSRGSPQFDNGGLVTNYRGVVIDITDRKLLENQLKISNELLQSVLDTIPLYICWKNCDSKFLGCNKNYSDMVGLKNPHLINNLTDRDMPWTSSQINNILACDRRIMDSNAAEYHLIESFVNSSGELLWYDTSKVPLHDENQEVCGILYVFQDITEWQQYQEKLLEAIDKAEASNKAKSEFLANMSHEIRTPLNGIAGMFQLLQLTDPNKEQEDYILNGIKSTSRLTKLLSDILDISRMEAGKVSIIEEEFSVESLAEAVLDLFAPAAKAKSLDLTFKIDKMMPRKLIGDEARIRQILFNFVGNSIKFTQIGAINIHLKSLLADERINCKALFIVSDTGIGITDEQLNSVFDPFFQCESLYTRQHQGAGLGLSIVRKLVKIMNGELAIDNTPGEGTTVYLTLPLKVPNRKQIEKNETLQNMENTFFTPPRILLVEDDKINLLTGKRILEKSGYTVFTAGNGQEAVDILSKHNFDIIIMDIQMPVLDGVEATKMIRESTTLGPKAQIPIIAMTSYAMTGDKEKFLASGMDDYIAKPFDIISLKNTIAKILKKTVKANN